MPKRNAPARLLWGDRFAAPTPESLLAALEPAALANITALRTCLTAEHDCRESLRWCGLPWRWTLSYHTTPASEPDATAHLVPNPAAPSVVFRLTHEEFSDLPLRKLSRYIRDGLSQAKLVAGISWPEWVVQSESNTADLIELFRLLRQRAMAGA